MCDDLTEKENQQYLGRLSRREFGLLAASTGFAMLFPPVANAMAVSETDVSIVTPDGQADCYFVHPQQGAHPAVLVWPDIMGLRPAFRAMAKRLAEAGYAVLVVNPYYRTQAAPVVPANASFADAEVRNAVFALYKTLSPTTTVTDATALVGWLDQQPQVDSTRKMGTIGYCMGGPMVMRTAAALPQRIGAGGSFHGGGFVTDQPDSPHLLIEQMQADFLIAIAENDDQREPEVKNVLRDAFQQHGLNAEIEVYAGAMHGWCALDSHVYHKQQAERAWARLLVLLDKALG